MTAALLQPHDKPVSASPAVSTAFQAYRILQIGFVVAPFVAGADKCMDKLVNWDLYLWAPMAQLFGGAHNVMMIAGAIEIVAGIGIAAKPRYFGYIVSAWLFGIVVNLLLTRAFYDVALQDFGLCLAALALARLAQGYDHRMCGGLQGRRI